MKMTMRGISKRTALLAASFVLAVNSLTVIVPFVTPTQVGAVAEVQATVSAGGQYKETAAYKGVSVEVKSADISNVESIVFQFKTISGYEFVVRNTPGTTGAINALSNNGITSAVLAVQNFSHTSGSWTHDGVWASNEAPAQVRVVVTYDGGKVASSEYRNIVSESGPTAQSIMQGYTLPVPPLTAPVNLRPVSGSVVKGSPVQTWTHESHSNVEKYIYESYSSDVISEGNLIYRQELNAQSRVVAGTQSLEMWWRVGAKAANGNITWSTLQKLIVDNTAPVIEHISPVAGSIVGSSASFKFRAVDTVSGVRNVNLHLFKNGKTVKIIALSQDPSGDTWSANNVSLAGLAAGEYGIVSRATDNAGNTQFTGSNHGVFTIDRSRPDVALITPTVELLSGKLSVKVSAEDNRFGINRITANIYKNGSLHKSSSSNVVGAPAVHDAVFDLEDGVYVIVYNAQNSLGNISETKRFTVTIDSTSPVANLSVSNVKNGSYVSGSVSITGSAEEAVAMKSHWFEITGPNGYILSDASGLNTRGSAHTINWNTVGLQSGEYKIRYVATDAAGNRSDAPSYTNSTVLRVIVDNVAPKPNAMLSADLIVSDKHLPTLTTDAEDAVMVDYTQYRIQTPAGDNIPGFGWNNISNSSTILLGELKGLEDGDYRVNVRTFDAAGNKKNQLIPFTVDRTVTTTVSVSSLSSTSPTISGVMSYSNGLPVADEPIIITVAGVTYEVVTDAQGAWSINALVNGSAEGIVHTVVATIVDGGRTTATYTFATTIPSIIAEIDPQSEPEQPSGETAESSDNPMPRIFAQVLGDSARANEELNREADDAEVKGVDTVAQAEKATEDANKGILMGLAWYWWLLIVAGALGLLWWIVAAVRRRNEEEA